MDLDAPEADDGEVLHDAEVVRKSANRGRRRSTTIVVAAALIAGAASGGTVGYLMHSTKTVVTTRSVVTTARSNGQTTDPLRAVAGCVASINTSVVGVRVWSVTMDSGGLPETAESEGSGFVFATGGLIATSAHVIADASQIEVVFADGATQTASVVGKDTEADLAGGPLLTASGAVVGINTASAVSSGQMSAQNIGFAIPIARAAPILAELARTGS